MKSTHNDFRGHNLLFQEVQVCRRCSYNTLMGSLMVFWGVGVIWLLTSKKKSTIITDLCRIVSIRLYSLWMRLYCMTISADTIKHYQICLYISVKSFTSQYWPEGIGILLKIHHLSSFPSFQAFQSLPKSPPPLMILQVPQTAIAASSEVIKAKGSTFPANWPVRSSRELPEGFWAFSGRV